MGHWRYIYCVFCVFLSMVNDLVLVDACLRGRFSVMASMTRSAVARAASPCEVNTSCPRLSVTKASRAYREKNK